MRNVPRVALLALLLAGSVRPVQAQSPPLVMRVPGTSAVLAQVAGLQEPLPRWRVFREVIRRVYGAPDDKAGTTGRVLAYATALYQYEARLSGVVGRDGTIALGLAAQKDRHDRLKDFLAFVGFKLVERNRAYRVEPEVTAEIEARRTHLRQAGIDVDSFERALNAGEPVTAQLPADEVLLPLPEDAWPPAFGETSAVPPRQLALAILLNRSVALLYHGLTALDGPTRVYLAGPARMLPRLVETASPFATLSAGLHVTDGKVVVPGGAPAEPLWEALVGESPGRPERFIHRLYSADAGKLAYFYDALAHLPPVTLAFALDAAEPDPQTRARRFQKLYAACSTLFVNWTPATLAFNRTAGDGADLLQRVAVDPAGGLAGPPWVTLWSAVFGSTAVPDDPARTLENLERDGRVDAATLVSWLCVSDFGLRRERTALFLFAQRVFPRPGRDAAPHVLAALRGFSRHPALLLVLERMGVTDPVLLEAAARTAWRLSTIGDQEVAARSLTEFQAALAILDRARFSRTLGAAAARDLVRSLVALPLSEDGEYAGHLARWWEADLLPALASAVGPRVTGAEALVMAALAGRTASPSPSRRLLWEEVAYRVDPARAEQARLDAIRRTQAGNRLDAVLAFARASATLATSVADLGALKSALAALGGSARGLETPRRIGVPNAGPVPDLGEAVRHATTAAARITKAKDLDKLAGIAAPLVRLADFALADTLTALAYAAALGDPAGTASLTPDLGTLHDFGMKQPAVELRQRAPWLLPVQSFAAGAAWHVTGSLLGLDVALSSLSLHRVATDQMPLPPTLNENERQALSEAVVFSSRDRFRDEDRDRIASAVAQGMAAVAALPTSPERLDPIAAAAPLPEWRAEALRWLLVHEPAELDRFFGLSELLRIGWDGDPGVALDAWGTSDVAWGGGLGLRFPGRQAWEAFEGRRGLAGLAARFPDLSIWVALGLAAERLPAELAGDVLAMATQDMIDEAQLIHFDDWIGAVRFARQLPRLRLDDYIAALTATGPLVPEDK